MFQTNQTMNPFISVAIVVLLWAIGIYLSVKTALIRDLSMQTPKPYSFSRTQLLWWTLIITSCYILGFGYSLQLPAINDTVLILLGIGLGTTTAARIVDNTQANNTATVRHQDAQASQGFFMDILSDESGISVHRFQAVVFNLIFGVSFLYDFISDSYVFPSYDYEQLALLGISSGAYIALKMNENSINTQLAQAQQQAPVNAPAANMAATNTASTFNTGNPPAPNPAVPPVPPANPS